MIIRKTQTDDLDQVLNLFTHARQFMKDNNNVNQWIDGYPQRFIIEQDIKDGKSYVVISDNKVVATFYYAVEPDPTYSIIDHGTWLDNSPYGVIHRITTDSQTKGVGVYCINWCYSQCNNLRVDTHKNNTPMHNLLLKCGFSQCGIIYIKNGDERVAYQKI